MRPLEVVLLLADLFAYVSVLLPKPRAPRWLRYPAFAALPIAGAQAVIEGPRWQMIPAYLFGALIFLAGIVRSRRWASTPGKNRPLVTYLGAGLRCPPARPLGDVKAVLRSSAPDPRAMGLGP